MPQDRVEELLVGLVRPVERHGHGLSGAIRGVSIELVQRLPGPQRGVGSGHGRVGDPRLDKLDYRTYVLLGDGEIAEGAVWEAASLAGVNELNNLIAVVETLLQTARPYVFTTASPPLLACALQASLAIIRDEPQRRERLSTLIACFRAGTATLPWRVLPSETAIQPLVVGANADALALSAALWQRGLWVPAIRPPTVPQGTARLRIALSAAHAEADVARLLAALAEFAERA